MATLSGEPGMTRRRGAAASLLEIGGFPRSVDGATDILVRQLSVVRGDAAAQEAAVLPFMG
jgi:hypothetical protein